MQYYAGPPPKEAEVSENFDLAEAISNMPVQTEIVQNSEAAYKVSIKTSLLASGSTTFSVEVESSDVDRALQVAKAATDNMNEYLGMA